MSQSVLKWGNSLAFRIPAAVAKQMQIDAGAEVDLHLDGKRLIVEKATRTPKFSHRDLVQALQKARKYQADLGKPRGKEIF